MPTQTALIGPNTLPIPAGSANSDLEDLTVVGLADYLRFWLRNTLNTKLGNLAGTSAEACASNAVYDYNPEDGAIWARNSVPALYCWWDGTSQDVAQTMAYRHIAREISVLYVFDELVMPGDAGARSGLMALANAAFHKAAERGRHPSYSYGSDAAGTPIAKTLNWVEFWYLGGTPGMLWEVPGGAYGGGTGIGEGNVQRGHPALKGKFRVVERIEQDQLVFPDDVLGDADLAIETGDTTQDTITILNRILPPPDGSDPNEDV